MNFLERYSEQILGMHDRGMTAREIATHLYDNAAGDIDNRYRDLDIAAISGAVRRYLADPSSGFTLHAVQSAVIEEMSLERERRAAENARRLLRREAERERRAAEDRQLDLAREARRLHWEEERAKVAPWRDRNWEDALPPELAKQQTSWCRHMVALRMREAGLTLDQVGYRLGVSKERVRQIVEKAQRYEKNPHGNRSPLERWMAESVMFETRWQEYDDPSYRKRARRALEVVEVWTGRETVPPCSRREAEMWELYYAMRGAA